MNPFDTQRVEICRVGRSMFERGLVHATAGNISVRLPAGQGFLITPTDACLGQLQPDQLAHADLAGHALNSVRASKTLTLHRAIYGAEPEAHCVIHTHSTHLVALTLGGVWRADCILPPITPYFVMKVGRVPLIPYHRPGDPAVATLVAAAIAAAHARRADTRRDARPAGPDGLARLTRERDGRARRARRDRTAVADDGAPARAPVGHADG
jgi:3-dehydro-4-phosphotetronate decarboxylase